MDGAEEEDTTANTREEEEITTTTITTTTITTTIVHPQPEEETTAIEGGVVEAAAEVEAVAATPTPTTHNDGVEAPPPTVPRPLRLAHQLNKGLWPASIPKWARKIVLEGWNTPVNTNKSNTQFDHLKRMPERRHTQQGFTEQMDEYIRLGVLAEPDQPVYMTAPVFPVMKANGKVRCTTDFRHVNEIIVRQPEKYKLPHPEELAHIIPHHMKFATTIDLKDAYNHIPVGKQMKRFLGARYKGHTYQWQAIGFGLAHAPSLFVRLLRATLTSLREALTEMGAMMVDYMDDFLILAPTSTTTELATTTTLEYLERIGWTANPAKSNLTPTSTPTFLGFEWNLEKRTVTLPMEKQKKYRENISKLLRRAEGRGWVVRDLAVILGSLQAASLVLLHDRWKMREIQIAMKGKSMNSKVTQTAALRKTLSWWKTRLHPAQKLEAPMADRSAPIHLTISSDASDEGYGALNHTTMQTIQGHWRGKDLEQRIEVKEMKAAAMALDQWTTDIFDKRIKLLVDNSITVSYLNKAKGGRKRHLNAIMAKTWKRCREHRITLDVEWISTHENTIPDKLSRQKRDRNDYKLNPTVWKQICKRFKWRPTVDLFATSENRQKTPKFCSRFGSPGAWKTNTLALTAEDMKKEIGWANPPWPIIGSTISWINNTQTPCLLCTPWWVNSPWWGELKRSAYRVQKWEVDHGTFVNSLGQTMPKPRWNLALALFRPNHT